MTTYRVFWWLVLVGVIALSQGCTFEGEDAKNCYREETITTQPGNVVHVIKEMIVCPGPPPGWDGGS